MDPIESLVQLLQADSSISALVGSKVYGGGIPRSENTNMPQPAVTLKPAGGGMMGTETANWGDMRVDVDCFAATEYDSWQLYLVVAAALKGLRRQSVSGVLLHWARPSSRGLTAIDPMTEWPVTISSWQVLASGVA